MAGEENEEVLERAAHVFRELAAIPYLTKANILSNTQNEKPAPFIVTSQWTQRDLDRNENRVFQRSHCVTLSEGKEPSILETGFPAELHKVQKMSTSPSRKYQLILRGVSESKQYEDKQFLEIWSQNNIIRSIDVKEADKHGLIYTDSLFSCFNWSASEKYVLYVAEKKKPKRLSYFEKDKEAGADTPPASKGDHYLYEEDWGEQLVKKNCPVLAMLAVHSGEITIIPGIPDYLSVGQACWTLDDKGVVFSGWWHKPYRLGLVYCSNRRGGVFHVKVDGSGLEQLSSPEETVAYPNINPITGKLYYLARDCIGVHQTCWKLVEYNWKTKANTTIIDYVDVPGDDGFPGFYMFNSLSSRCWSKDGTKLILASIWRSSQHILCVDVNKCTLVRITKAPGCWDVLDVYQDLLLASFSSPSQPHQIYLMHIPTELSRMGDLGCTEIASSTNDSSDLFNDIEWKIETFPSLETGEGFNADYEGVLVQPIGKETKPLLIVLPHGGPQSVYNSSYIISSVAMCKLGFAVLWVNYKGSVGFGRKSLQSIIGKVGTQDVREVMAAAENVLSRGAHDPHNLFVMGGSHGGFLSAHLIGQYPDKFRACAARNPVIDISSMVTVTDIPDWCFVECGFDFDYNLATDSKTMADMWEKSPIAHVHKVRTPVLLCIGAVDRRVPPSQGIHFHRVLRERGVETKLLLYPEDAHPLDKVGTESDVFVNTVRWFHEHRV
ncbi:acylamino-acid-releasing enzyme isoform X1 [Nematostella vectensis]|uniref:acylamino-acid-releasing enzyme isoform X1 n=1 Tax=Nematostella vectensis TaxID=45351 RepID=UPI0020778791|nr:acylamino-acid-releasing enzyme isoform X1 [Nematostella vectensis]